MQQEDAMTTILFEHYHDLAQVKQVIQKLLNAGFARDSISIIDPAVAEQLAASGSGGQLAYHDRNVERQGSFADVEPSYHDRNVERQGSFADVEPSYHDRAAEPQGSFANTEPSYHNRNVERKGSFADIEPAGDRDSLVHALMQAGLTANDAASGAAQLRQGASLVLIHLSAEEADLTRASGR
jgi:hypothetical protein